MPMALPTARRRRLRGLCSHVAGAMSESKPLFVSLDGTEVELEESLLGDLCEVLCLGAQSPAELPDDVLARADIIAVWHTIWIDEALVKKIANAKMIVRMGASPALFVQLLLPECHVASCLRRGWIRQR
eukprot:COSAG04_NODE_212_length_20108_cov_107.515418_8_plen_129_part_00